MTSTDAAPPGIDIARATTTLADQRVGHTIRLYPSLPSTMNVAREWAGDAGIPSGAVVLAEEQTAGRGRMQRRWEAPAGRSLLLSILLRNTPSQNTLPSLPIVAGLALLDAVAHVAPELTAGLKWPNDLLIGHDPETAGKAAGVLIESAFNHGRMESAIVGIGINVNQRHEELPAVHPPARTPTSLAVALGRTLDRTDLLIALCRCFSARLVQSEYSLLSHWRDKLWTLGRPVRAHHANGSTIDGVAVDVTPAGGLLIETVEGRRVVVDAGDVSLRGA